MPSIKEYDVVRLRVILRDLAASLNLGRAAIELDAPSGATVPVRGAANRAAVARLGLDLMHAAVEAEDRVVISGDGRALGYGASDQVLVLTIDEELEPPRARASGPGIMGVIGCVVVIGLMLGAGFLMMVGAITVVGWWL